MSPKSRSQGGESYPPAATPPLQAVGCSRAPSSPQAQQKPPRFSIPRPGEVWSRSVQPVSGSFPWARPKCAAGVLTPPGRPGQWSRDRRLPSNSRERQEREQFRFNRDHPPQIQCQAEPSSAPAPGAPPATTSAQGRNSAEMGPGSSLHPSCPASCGTEDGQAQAASALLRLVGQGEPGPAQHQPSSGLRKAGEQPASSCPGRGSRDGSCPCPVTLHRSLWPRPPRSWKRPSPSPGRGWRSLWLRPACP